MPLGEKDCLASYKVLVVGETSVGKTALINNLVGREFRESMVPTIGVDFVKKIFEVDGALIQLVIWDTAGQERFRSITKYQYRGVQGIVLVYDVTNIASFSHLTYWITSIQYEVAHCHSGRGRYEPIPIILCGNKCDMDEKRRVKPSKGYKLAEKEMAFEFFETSAKTGTNVFPSFQRLAYHVTDIHNPKLMKSYHPYMIRCYDDTETTDEARDHFKPRRTTTKKDKIVPKDGKKCDKLKKSLCCGCFR
ncbi:ras-related protein Rab-13-like [Haliotis rufescens]|uniref:ras-related protein Rab-13-like n=1 Tax=Haliotis rufescens TaxID=6454 RepID=UPI00201E86C1|nr:ras-related protein Rab-13-like [Haliotis rufescens]